MPPSLRTSNVHQSSMVAFLLHPVLIFDSRETVHRSLRRLPSASLAALRPSSAGLESMQTSSASATQRRHTRGLSSASSAKREDFSGCAPSERLFFDASGISAGKRVTSNCRVFNSGELRGRGTSYGGGESTNQRATQRGCM